MKFARSWLFCLLFLSPLAWSETRLLVANVPPYGYVENDFVTGVGYDLLQEAARRVGHSGRIELMPVARMLEVTKIDPNVLATIPRQPTTEAHYRWLVELVRVPIVLMAAKNSDADISTIQAARNLRLGVINASPAEQIARANGFTRIEVASRAEGNAIKLSRGRIDVWMVTLPEGSVAQKRAGLPTDGLRIGAQVDILRGYVAANPEFDAVEAAKWSAAFTSMKKDGTYAKIVRKYNIEPVP